MSEKRKVLRWSREPPETGLGRSWQVRGWILKHGGEEVGRVAAVRPIGSVKITGWYWCSRTGDRLVNTAHNLVASDDEAKRECEIHVRKVLGKMKGGGA